MSEEPDELARIRQRKIHALVEEKRRQEVAKEAKAVQKKEREKLLRIIFMPDAIAYLEELRKSKPQLASRIEDIAILLYSQQQLPGQIPKMGVLLVQRRLEGVESRITVKRRGEDAVSLYEAVRKDLSEHE
ncbi:MAG: DNA-binding protein [Promethearchaeota archaeon]